MNPIGNYFNSDNFFSNPAGYPETGDAAPASNNETNYTFENTTEDYLIGNYDLIDQNLKVNELQSIYTSIIEQDGISIEDFKRLHKAGIDYEKTFQTKVDIELLSGAATFLKKSMDSYYRQFTEHEESFLKLLVKIATIYSNPNTFRAGVSENTYHFLTKVYDDTKKFPHSQAICGYRSKFEKMKDFFFIKNMSVDNHSAPFNSIDISLFVRLFSDFTIGKPTALFPVGFDNSGHSNCWANSLLHVIFSIPAYKNLYLEMTDHFRSVPGSSIGESLEYIIKSYEKCFSTQQIIPTDVAQTFRLVLHDLSEGLISKARFQQCDPHEALMILFNTYQNIHKDNWKENPLFCKTKVESFFTPTPGAPIKFAAEFLEGLRNKSVTSKENHTRPKFMPPENRIEENDFPSSLDVVLPKTDFVDFNVLLHNFFNNSDAMNSDPAYFEIGNGISCSFSKTKEKQAFIGAPEYFLLTLKRFDRDLTKIYTKTDIPLQFTLKQQETGDHTDSHYELVSFIEHIGSFQAGHYVHYQKFEGHWIMLNDARRAHVSENEIQKILSGNKTSLCESDSTSYMHFYVKQNPLKRVAEELDHGPASKRLKLGSMDS